MSVDYQGAKTMYAISGIIIVLVLLLLSQSMYKSHKKYKEGRLIAIKTSRGLIKMNALSVAEELAKLQAELARHEGLERTSKFDEQITDLIDHIKQFIAKNPDNKELCNSEIKADIINKALLDHITPHQQDQHMAHAAILSHDDLEYSEDSVKFEYLLRNMNVLIHMLKHDVCDCGLLDVEALETLLRALDADLTQGATYDKSNGHYSDSSFMTDIGRDLLVRHDPYAIPRLSLFASKASQIEGLSIESQVRIQPEPDGKHYTIGPSNVRDVQQRSDMFRINRQKIGDKHYVDEDLLFTPTYAEMAL